jgi:hypothetical protein
MGKGRQGYDTNNDTALGTPTVPNQGVTPDS